MGILDRLRNPALAELVREQNLKELLIRREFRISQGYLQREIIERAKDEDIQELTLTIGDGFAEIAGKVKKRLIPFAIPFSATLSVQGMEFSSERKCVTLRMERCSPLDFDWLTAKLLERIPFLSCSGDLIRCDLTRVPRLAELFAYRVKGINVWDFVTLKELKLKNGEITGRVGVVI